MAEDSILGFLQNNDSIYDSQQFAATVGINHSELENAIKSLRGFEIVDSQEFQKDRWFLKEEGKTYARDGSPEVQFFNAVPPEGISKEELQKKLNPTVFKIGSSWAVKKKWVEIGRQGVSRKVEHVDDKIQDFLQKIEIEEAVDEKDLAELKNRKLIEFKPLKGYSVRKGPKYVSKRKKAATDLTREHLLRGDWRDLEFKEYNLSAQVQPIQIGYLQPLLKVRDAIQSIFIQMG